MKKNITFSSLLFLSLFWILPSSAQTVYVNQNASGANNGTTWNDAYVDLVDALENTSSGDIWIATGIYHPGQGTADTFSSFRITEALSLYGGFEGLETNLSDRDVIANPTTLTGDFLGDDVTGDFSSNKLDNVQHVVYVDSLLSGTVVFDGLTVSGGHTSDFNDQSEYFWRGGGIFAYSSISVTNCTFADNFGRSGASIYLSPNGGDGANNSTIEDCSFKDNYASAQSAGVFANSVSNINVTNCVFEDNLTNRGAFYPLYCDDVTLTSCTFTNNTGEFIDGFGGAIFNWNTTGFVISDCTFTENTGGNGAVMYHVGNESSIDNQHLVIEDCTFTDNEASDFGGGVLYCSSGSFSMNNCTLENNLGANGSHLFLTGDDKDIVITNTSFSGGAAQYGAAHSCYGTNSTFLLENNTYEDGTAENTGGALIIGFQALVTANNCTFSQNNANFGGAVSIQNDSTFANFSNCDFLGNSANTSGGGLYQGGGIVNSLDKCRFSNNTAGSLGGGMYAVTFNDDLETGHVTIQNSTFLSNVASENGGGLSLIDMSTDLVNTVFGQNLVSGTEAVGGGGISNVATNDNSVVVNIVNSTFSENIAPLGAGISHAAGDTESFNIMNIQNSVFENIGTSYEVEVGAPEANSLGGNVAIDLSPIWTDPTDQMEVSSIGFVDGLGFDYRLTAFSPAIDAGVADGAPALDIEGNPRIGEVDSGAYEFDPATSVFNSFVEKGSLVLLKNPIDKTLNFELTNKERGEINMSIFDIMGQEVMQWEVTKGSETILESINIENLTGGTYLLFVRSNNTFNSSKFIKL